MVYPVDEKLKKRIADNVEFALPKVRENLRDMRVLSVRVVRGYLEADLEVKTTHGATMKWVVGSTAIKGLKPLIKQMGVVDYGIAGWVIHDLMTMKDPDVVREHKRLKSELAVFEKNLATAKAESRKDEMRSELRTLIRRGKRVFGLSKDQMVSLFQEELKLLEVEEVFLS